MNDEFVTLAESAEACDLLAANTTNEAERFMFEMNARMCRQLLEQSGIEVLRIPKEKTK